MKENILLQRQRWPGKWILRNRHTWAQLPTLQERQIEHTLSIPSPHQQQRSHKGSLQGRLPCTPLLPAAWTGRREKKGKRWPRRSRLLWSNSCFLTICEQEVKKLLNSTAYTTISMTQGSYPKASRTMDSFFNSCGQKNLGSKSYCVTFLLHSSLFTFQGIQYPTMFFPVPASIKDLCELIHFIGQDGYISPLIQTNSSLLPKLKK